MAKASLLQGAAGAEAGWIRQVECAQVVRPVVYGPRLFAMQTGGCATCPLRVRRAVLVSARVTRGRSKRNRPSARSARRARTRRLPGAVVRIRGRFSTRAGGPPR
jgi:hypothetical protein